MGETGETNHGTKIKVKHNALNLYQHINTKNKLVNKRLAYVYPTKNKISHVNC